MPLEPDSPDDDPYQSTVWESEGGSLLEMMIDTASWSDVDMEAVRTRFCIAADMTCAHLGQPAVSVGALLCDDQRASVRYTIVILPLLTATIVRTPSTVLVSRINASEGGHVGRTLGKSSVLRFPERPTLLILNPSSLLLYLSQSY